MKLLKDIKNFVEGTTIKMLNDMNFITLPIHFKEQVIYRAYLCQDCLSNGECLICHCSTPTMFYSPNKEDSNGKWSKFMNSKEWDSFKSSDNLKEFNNVLSQLNLDNKNDKDDISNLSNNDTLEVPITRDFINFVNTIESYNNRK